MTRYIMALIFGALAFACMIGVFSYPFIWIRENVRRIRNNNKRIKEIENNR